MVTKDGVYKTEKETYLPEPYAKKWREDIAIKYDKLYLLEEYEEDNTINMALGD